MTKYIIIMQARTPLLLCTTRWSFLHQHGRGTAELQSKHTNTSKLINCQKEASRKRNREMWKEERTDDVFFFAVDSAGEPLMNANIMTRRSGL
jgi:hypothetical protein